MKKTLITSEQRTPGQEKQFIRLIKDVADRAAELALGKVNPDKEGLQQLFAQGDKLKLAIAEVVIAKTRELTTTIFFTPLADSEVPEQLQHLVPKWRKLAALLGYTGPVAWRVNQGFTLKQHAPKAGCCYENFEYLQGWNLQNDEPTKNSIVFWIPRLIPESLGKNVQEKLALLASFREQVGLPAHHLKNFGSAALLAGLIFAHFKRAGERTPLNELLTRTDTLLVGGYRLRLGDFDSRGLFCGYWIQGDGRISRLGCFPLGVEELGI